MFDSQNFDWLHTFWIISKSWTFDNDHLSLMCPQKSSKTLKVFVRWFSSNCMIFYDEYFSSKIKAVHFTHPFRNESRAISNTIKCLLINILLLKKIHVTITATLLSFWPRIVNSKYKHRPIITTDNIFFFKV